MFRDVVKAFLYQAIGDDLSLGGQTADTWGKIELDSGRIQPAKAVTQLTQGSEKAKLFEHRWAQGRNDAPDLDDRLFRYINGLQQFGTHSRQRRRKRFLQHLQLQADTQHGLSGF